MNITHTTVTGGGNSVIALLQNGDYNMAGSGITITVKREVETTDFSETYFPAGTGFLTYRPAESSFLTELGKIFASESTARTLAMLATFSLFFANLLYFTERGVNEDFPVEDYTGGVSSGLWWSIVTVTTTGYGDITPQSRMGRFIGALWMGVGLVIMASFSADVLSRLTAARTVSASSGITGPADVKGMTCCTIDGTPFVGMCADWGAKVVKRNHRDECYNDLIEKRIDFVAYDWPVLELWYLATDERKSKYSMPWRSTTDGPFAMAYPHLAMPSSANGVVDAEEVAALSRQMRMRDLFNAGVLALRHTDFEDDLVSKYFNGLSLENLDAHVAVEDDDGVAPAKFNDPYVIVGIVSIILYLALIAFHELGFRIKTNTIVPTVGRNEPAAESEDDYHTHHGGLARANEVHRLERKVDRLMLIFEMLEDRMIDRNLVSERDPTAMAKVARSIAFLNFIKKGPQGDTMKIVGSKDAGEDESRDLPPLKEGSPQYGTSAVTPV